MAARIAIWSIGLALALASSACGFLDDDILLSDAQFEASFAREAATRGTISGSGTVRSYGCGLSYNHSHGHGHGRLGHRHDPRRRQSLLGGPQSNPDARQDARRAGARATKLVVVGEDEEQPTSTLHTATMETWGNYLEAEWKRSQRARR